MAVQENEYTSKMNELKGLLTRKCFDYAYEEIAFSLLNEELVKYREMVGVLTSDLTSSEMLNTSLNHQFNQLKEDNDKNSKALLESTVLVNKLEGQLNQAMDSNATLLEQSKSLSASQSKIAKERDLSKLELEALQQRLASAESDVKSLTGQVKDSAVKLSTAISSVDGLHATNESLMNALKSAELMVPELEAEISRLTQEKENYATKDLRLTGQVEELESKLSSTSGELSSLREISNCQRAEIRELCAELVAVAD